MRDIYPQIGEEHFAEFLRRIAIDFDKRANPVFEGHRTTYPGQQPVTYSQAIGLGIMYTSPAAFYAAGGHQLLSSSSKNVGIVTSPHGSIHLGGGEEIYYPFKGIVDVIFK